MIRFAEEKDLKEILALLVQVNKVHHDGRPDVFRLATKYQDEELIEMIHDHKNPIFVYADDNDKVKGYAFCIHKEVKDDHLLCDMKSLYIDDLCVDENERGSGIGTKLYHHVCSYAKEMGYYNVTLNVWALNESAERFYRHLGLKPLKTYMENILE